jgi:hypothetical protein
MKLRWVLFVLGGLCLGGCVISEQIGEAPHDLVFHFGTGVNRVIVYGRSAVLAAIGIWILNAWGKKAGALVVALGLFGVAAWLVYVDYPTLSSYRVGVLDTGLYLNIPPEPERTIDWASVEEMKIEGVEWASIGAPGAPPGMAKSYAWSELPDWKTMELVLENGETHQVDLERLSIEQRQILWRAIARRARLVEAR